MRLFEGTTEAYLGMSDTKFTKGVLVGDTIRCIGTITEKRLTSKGGGLTKIQIDIVNQRNEVCQSRVSNILIKREPPEKKGL
jgi:acyl dehydratase